MSKEASPDHPVHELVARRWSPYGFADREVADDVLASLFEAARWAASAFNEQPWRYIVARRSDREAFARMLPCLVEANQAWAQAASALVLGICKTEFSHNSAANRVALHDLGLAAATLTFEATARGLHVHQMAGIVPETIRSTYDVPEGYEPATAIAIGYAAELSSLPPDIAKRDAAPRARKPLAEFVFGQRWDDPAPFV